MVNKNIMVKVISHYANNSGDEFTNEIPTATIDDGKNYVAQNLDALSKRVILPSTKTEEDKTTVTYDIYNLVKIEVKES